MISFIVWMSILDWYFGQKSQKKINKEIVGRLENDLRRCLNETDKYTNISTMPYI